ncbi:3-dehydroquinate synthase family protein [Candidatus Vidania fulgoroideorum]
MSSKIIFTKLIKIKKIINKNCFIIIDKKIKKFKKKSNYIIKNENCKNINTIKKIANKMIKSKCNKNTKIICIGGGVTGDISGFISSIFMRGIKFYNIPTTLLSQVDSSIGAKNGVNLFAKNLLGTIYITNKIFICFDFLKTLKKKVFYDGFSEIIKISIINNKKLFNYIIENKKIIKKKIKKIIYYSIKSKIKIIEKDLYENNLRIFLNLGHTFAHSIEKVLKYNISHGNAVYIGILMSSLLSYELNYLKKKSLYLIFKIIKFFFKKILFFLNKLNMNEIKRNFKVDKKYDGKIKLIVINKIGKVIVKRIKIKKIKIKIKKIGELVKKV